MCRFLSSGRAAARAVATREAIIEAATIGIGSGGGSPFVVVRNNLPGIHGEPLPS